MIKLNLNDDCFDKQDPCAKPITKGSLEHKFIEAQEKKITKKQVKAKPRVQVQRRRYCFTSYMSLEFDDYSCLEQDPRVKYYIIGKEVCPTTKRPHIQGYITFHDLMDFNTLKKLLPDDTTHVEVCKGNDLSNIRYCRKEGNYKEFGTPSERGKRNDLIDAFNDCKTLKLFIKFYPDLYARYRSGIEGYYRHKGEDYDLTDGKPLVIWLYGDSGAGKTRIVKDYLRVKINEGYRVWRRPLGTTAWFDGYSDQDIVFLDEVRGSTYKFDDLLQMLDYDCPKVPIKGGFTEFRPKVILITSNAGPKQCYEHINDENKVQLARRCDYIKKIKEYEEDYLINLE